MPVLKNVQIKSVAKFLKVSCDKVPASSPPLKLSQWLDILSMEFSFKDWNVTSANNRNEPELIDAQNGLPVFQHGFLGVARVVLDDESPTHHLCYAENREWSRFDIAAKLAEKIRSRLGPTKFNLSVGYSRPDAMANGKHELNWKNRNEGCPIVIKSDAQEMTILLWWLSASYLQNDPMPLWCGNDAKRNLVHFDELADHQLHEYGDSELNESLTNVFLASLTRKPQTRRSCWYVPRGTHSLTTPMMLLVEEGNPKALQVVKQSTAESWDGLRSAAEVMNEERGLSKLDCEVIFARYESAERTRAEDDVVDFSGVYDD